MNYDKLKSHRVEMLIRKKYSFNEELAILRQRDTKPEEYAEYFNYCEQCKQQADEFVAQLKAKAIKEASDDGDK